MKMKKFMQIMALLLVVFSVLSLTACKKYHMSEEEIKEACISEAEYFVGGYLRNDGPDFLEKYGSLNKNMKARNLKIIILGI